MHTIIPFRPVRFGANPHFQTIAAHLLATNSFTPHFAGLENTIVQLPTQEGSGDRLVIQVHHYEGYGAESQPAILLVHGLEGNAESIYVVKFAEKLLRAGFHVVRMNLRGCGPGASLARYPYSAALTIDLETVLEYTQREVAPIVGLVGFSLGAALTLKYVSEDRDERNRQRAVFGAGPIRGRLRDRHIAVWAAASPPLDVLASSEVLDGPRARTYCRRFLKEALRRVRNVDFPHLKGHMEELQSARTFFEFDNLFTAPLAGFRSAIEYYKCASNVGRMTDIELPGLVLHAYDDPLMEPTSWHEINWDAIPHVTGHLTETGGHLGWVAERHPLFSDRRWMDYRLLHYFLDWRDSLVPARRRPEWWARVRDWFGIS